MKKLYEKPELEYLDFTISNLIMDTGGIISTEDGAGEYDPDDII